MRVLAALLALGASALAISPVPRKSPEFTIVDPSGKQTLLSTLKGKVVLLEFVLANCPHCVRASATIDKVYRDLGPRGFEPVGIAFQPNLPPRMVTDLTRQLGVSYPIRCSTPEAVDSYLGRSLMERLMVPQIVVIDRQGVVRAQSGISGDPLLESEVYLRNLIGSLLQEGR